MERKNRVSPRIVKTLFSLRPLLSMSAPQLHLSLFFLRPLPIPEIISPKTLAPAVNTATLSAVSTASRSNPFALDDLSNIRFTSLSRSISIWAVFFPPHPYHLRAQAPQAAASTPQTGGITPQISCAPPHLAALVQVPSYL